MQLCVNEEWRIGACNDIKNIKIRRNTSQGSNRKYLRCTNGDAKERAIGEGVFALSRFVGQTSSKVFVEIAPSK